jgi:GNAT superfamily N-acetyltransferase
MRDYPSAQLTRRPAADADLPLIFSILRASLGPYVEQTWGVWDEAAQRKRFDEVTRAADHEILETDELPIGCLCLKTSDAEVQLVRLFILPEFQNHGFGTRILREVLALADGQSLPIRLRVLRVNPARRLYERHGFAVVEETETHYTMVRPASPRGAAAPR